MPIIPITWEAEAGRSEFEVNLDYEAWICLKTNKQTKKTNSVHFFESSGKGNQGEALSYWLNSRNEVTVFSTLSIIVAFINMYNPFHFPELGWSLTMPGALANSIQVSSPYLLDGEFFQRFYTHASKMGMEKSCSSQKRHSFSGVLALPFPVPSKPLLGLSALQSSLQLRNVQWRYSTQKEVTQSQKWVSGVAPVLPAANLLWMTSH